MKSLSSDFWVLSVGMAIIITLSTLLYIDFTSRLDVAHAQEIGTITFKKRVAQRKYSGQVIWEEVEQKTTLYNNDTIRTAELSEAVVKLKDGTNINLDENSMILLSLGDNAININFTQGSIYAKRGSGDGTQKINIQSKDTIVSINEKTDVQLSKNKEKDLNLTVTGGKAVVTIANEERTVSKDQKIIIKEGSKEAKIVKLQLKPISPSSNKYMVTDKVNLPVQFSWEKVKDAVVYFEIARDSNFKKRITSRKIRTNKITQPLRAGTYYWHLKAISKKDGKTEISSNRKFTIVSDKGIRLVNPFNKKMYSFSGGSPIINFKWTENDLASSYKIEISKDPAFKTIVKSIDTSLSGISVSKLIEGTYHWRIRSKIAIGDVMRPSVSSAYTFQLKRQKKAQPPELLAPRNNRIVSSALVGKKQFMFSWRSETRYKKYKLTVARDANFKDVVLSPVLNRNFYTVSHLDAKKLSVGSYYWRVQPFSNENIKVTDSKSRAFSIISTERLTLVSPNNKKIINLKEKQKNTLVTFNWRKTSIQGNYLFELSKEKTFTTVFKRQITKRRFVKIKSISSGKYYWRIRLLDSDKSQIMVSNSHELGINAHKKKLIAVVPPVDIKKTGVDTDKKEVDKGGSATLSIISPVEKSKIYINGRFKGYKQLNIKTVAEKPVTVQIRATGFKTFYRKVTLKRGENRTIRAQFISAKLLRRVKWKTNLNSQIISRPIYRKNILVVNTGGGKIVGLNKYGNVLWNRRLKSISKSSPAVSKDTVYVNTIDEQLYALNLMNGNIRWKKKLEGPLLFKSGPLAVDNKVYIATSHGKVYSFSKSGEELWKRDLLAGIFSSMAYYDDLLFIGTDQSLVYALDADDGDTDWDFEVDSRIIASSPKVYKETLYVGCYSGTFYAIDASRGRLNWKFKTNESIFANPAFVNDTVYIGSEDGYLYALNVNDGKLKWKFNTRNRINSEPGFLKEDLFIASGNTFFTLNKVSGKMKWSEIFPGKISTGATVIGKDVYIGLDNGEIVSIRSDLVNIVK